MPWENKRPTHVPTAIREAALKRDGYQCTATMRDGTRCTETTHLEADEINGFTPGHILTTNEIQTLCHWHHNKKTQGEAAAARALLPKRTNQHPPEGHPGLRTTT